MRMKQHSRTIVFRLLVLSLCGAFPVGLTAQVKSQKTESTGASSRIVSVERAEVAYVSGNDLVVKLENGELRHFVVPDSATAMVDGRKVTVHDLKPGMKLERTITTTITPKVITEVRSVTGTVSHVNPPGSVILTMENGKNQQFKIPKGQKFMVNGQETDAFSLRKGMKVSATRIIETPITVESQQRSVTGTAPPPLPADVPILIAEEKPAPAPVPAPESEPAPKALPKTGSAVPLLGFMGLLSLGLGVGLRAIRRFV